MNLSIKEAEYVLAIVEEGNMTRAAKRLYVAQPSLTLTVQKLEQQLGAKLFIREGNRMKATYEGERLIDACQKLVKICRDLENEFEDIKHLNNGKVIIGMPFNLICYMFPPLYTICQEESPEISAIPVEGNSKDLESLLLSGSLDFAIIPLPLGNPSAFNSKIIIDEQLVLSVPKDHWLNAHAMKRGDAKRSYIDLKLADRQSFVLSKPGQHVRQASEIVFKEAGITPKVSFVTKNVTTKITMSALGLGLAIFPEHYLSFSHPPEGANYYYIAGNYSLNWRVAIVWRKDSYLSNACLQCIDMLTKLFQFEEPPQNI